MQISVLQGTYSEGNDYRTSYPVNYVPVPKQNGISMGYLRPHDGIRLFSTVPGAIRGGVNFKEEAYFVCGDELRKVNADGTTTLIDRVDDDGKPVRFAFSFDRLAVCSAGKLYYLASGILSQVTDSDLGTANDVKFLGGYYLTTDGEFIVQTRITDPTAVTPFTYGSAEIDPDPIYALLINRNELHAVNRYTIETFAITGGQSVVEFFAFARINGAVIQKGAVGRDAACVYNEAIAFVGGGRNESPAVYLGENAQTIKLSTREIDQILAEYTPEQLSEIVVEARTDKAHRFLYIHLPDRTLVYDSAATLAMEQPVWFVLTSALNDWGAYRGRYFVWAYNKWLVGDPQSGRIGYLTEDEAGHWGELVRNEFSTLITWSETGGAVFHALELQVLSGTLDKRKIAASYTTDGKTWSQDRWSGEFQRRITWMNQGFMHGWRAYRFRGTSDAMISVARLDAKMEPLIL